MNRLSSWGGAIASLLIAVIAPAQETVHGQLSGRVTWSGHVVVDGDVVVPAGGHLTIARGTRVDIAPRDSLESGWNPNLVEIRVQGRLRIEGAEGDPVLIGPASGATGLPDGRESLSPVGHVYGSWHGIVLLGESSVERSHIAGLRIRGAVAGLQVPAGSPEVIDSVFRDCGTGIEVGCAYRDEQMWGTEAGRASPEIERCRFVACHTGIYCEGAAAPEVRASIFHRCRCALGNRRPGVTFPIRAPGMVVVRCLFSHNRTAVLGPVLARDSMWVGNGTAISMSEFHSKYVTQIEHSAVVACLFWDNEKIVHGEVGFGVGGVRQDPRFETSLTVLDADGPAIPSELRIADDSPARGVATDGGDLGPLGSLRDRGGALPLGLDGVPVTTAWAAPLAEGKGMPRKTPTVRAGGKLGGAWWALIDAEGGWIDLRGTFGVAEPAGVVAVTWVGTAAHEALVRIDGDLSNGVEVRWNGKSIAFEAGRRRAGAPVELRVKAVEGENALLVAVRGWGVAPRLAIAVEGDGAFIEPTAKAPSDESKAEVRSARIKKSRRAPRRIELKLGVPAHWAGDGGQGVVEILDSGGRVLSGSEQITVRVAGVRLIHLEQIPDTAAEGMTLRLTGVRRADGGLLGATESITLD